MLEDNLLQCKSLRISPQGRVNVGSKPRPTRQALWKQTKMKKIKTDWTIKTERKKKENTNRKNQTALVAF